MNNIREILEHYNFDWNRSQEIWIRNEGFGRKSTVEVMFKKLFIIHKANKLVHDHFIESFVQFVEIMEDNFGSITGNP
jgi:hypothetical protein